MFAMTYINPSLLFPASLGIPFLPPFPSPSSSPMMVARHITTTVSPVSSFKKILKSHTRRASIVKPSTPKAPIEALPTHLIWEIGRQSSLRDVLHLSLCSRHLRATLAPILYASVELKTNKHCKVALVAFSKQPEIVQHIRQLIVRPNSMEWTDAGDEMDEDILATLLANMAGQLRGLEAFEWDGMDMPHDDLWLALKKSCRFLKRISTSIGEDALNPSSPLWDFSDLRQISLNVRCHSLDWLAEGLPKTEKLPRKFWAMLLERCPRLEELTIGGSAPSPRVFDIRHITAGRWPRLRSITLGDMVLIASSKGSDQTRKDHAAFMAFFAAHPSLRTVSLQHAGGGAHFPTSFSLPPHALPSVTSFGGPLKMAKSLPNPRTLRHLSLTTLHHTPSSFPPTFAMLQDLKELVSLSIWMDLSFGSHASGSSFGGGRVSGESLRGSQSQTYDDVHMLRSLVSSSPGLKHLEVACFTRPTFSIREFSRLLHAAPNLESFVLTKVHKSSDEDATRGAARIITDNPNLRKFTVRTTHDSWFSPERGRVKQLGVYEVLGPATSASSTAPASVNAPAAGTPSATLLAHEWGQRNITGKPYSRHFVHQVAPKEPTAPPSSFGKHHHSLSLSRVHSFASSRSAASHERGAPGSRPQTPSQPRARTRTLSRWGSAARGDRGEGDEKSRSRSRRSSFSDVVGSITSALATLTSPRSSMSSGSASASTESAASHASVAWAEKDIVDGDGGGLGRSGSSGSSASGSAYSHCAWSQAGVRFEPEVEEDYVLV